MVAPSPSRFERIQVAPAYQLVAEAIEREVVSGRLMPGEPVGTEAELVRQFGVNRSTVREGIRALEESGFIQRGPDRRLYACLPRYNRLSSRMSRALALHEVTFRELFSVSLVLEVTAAEEAVAAATPEAIAEMEDNQKELEAAAAANDPVRVSQVDFDFHVLLAKSTGNRVLALSREPCSLLFFPTSELVCRRVPEGPARMIHAHRQIIDAIRNRDLETARLWMRRHIYDWRRGFERAGRDLDEPVERVYARSLPQHMTL